MDKRIIKPRKRLIEEEEPVPQTKKSRKQKKIRKPKPTKQPPQEQQPEPPQEQQPEPEPEQAQQPDDIQVNRRQYKDMYDPENPFWTKHYYTPNDVINNEYIRLTNSYGDAFSKLPPIFLNGIAQLEEKAEYKVPFKQAVSFKKLKAGEYETKGSKSDKTNISSVISFFTRNLPSFQKYKDVDDLSWVFKENRKLLIELLEYSFLRSLAITTIKSKLNAICRIIRIGLKTKNDYTYQKYAYLVASIGLQQEDVDDTNRLSELEVKKFVPFEFILMKQLELEQKFNSLSKQQQSTPQAYKLNQDLLLVSLYCLIPPLRDEVKVLKFTDKNQDKGDWVWFKTNGDTSLLLNEDKTKHEAVEFNLTRDDPFDLTDHKIVDILKQSYSLYPRIPLFATVKNGIYTQKKVGSISQNLIKIFSDVFPTINIGSSSLRSSYYSYVISKVAEQGTFLRYEVKKQIAFRMRTSVDKLDRNYLKSYYSPFRQDINQQIQPPPAINIQPEPIITNSNSYYKKLEKNKAYIENNKEKVYQQQKQYRQTIPKEEATRKRLLRLLNTTIDYRKHIRPATIKKYDFKLDENNKYY